MTNVREPILEPVPITSLRPTQITVGMREVMAKRKRWREKDANKGGKYLGKHMIPVVSPGPAMRRSRMPVRVWIQASLVSTSFSRSRLSRMRSGLCQPQPVIAAFMRM